MVNMRTMKEMKKRLPAEPNRDKTLWNIPTNEFLASRIIFSVSGIMFATESGKEFLMLIERSSMLVVKSSR